MAMLAQASGAGPRLCCRRHAALLAAAILAVAAARLLHATAQIPLLFACYGALHGAALSLSLRPRPAWIRGLVFVAAAALLCASLARLGMRAATLLAGHGVPAAFLVVALCGVAGAAGYAALLRVLLRYRPAPARLAAATFASGLAASAALVPMRLFPAGGSAWLAVLWWLAFSGCLCARACRPRMA